MRRKAVRFRRLVFFGCVAAGAFGLMLFARRGHERPHGAPQTPAGGAANTDGVSPRVLVEDARRYDVKLWSFALDRYALRIEDAAMTTALDSVLDRTGAELVVNGGFFDPEGKPIGLAVSDGALLSRLGKNLSGGVLTSDGQHAELHAAEGFVLPEGANFAIQCRPRLVVGGKANVKSDDGKRAERSALCVRDGGRTLDVVVVRGSDDGENPGPSLHAMAHHLEAIGCESALNLDGGPSTGVAWREEGSVKLLAPRAPIRHVVAFVER